MAKRENVFVSEDKLLQQRDYMQKVKALNEIYKSSCGNSRRAFTQTFGCQQNESDTEQLNGMLLQMGYELTEDKSSADLILMNTCAVREHAEQRVFGTVGALVHIKREKPSLIIALCGCMMSQPHIQQDIKQKYRHVDLLFGTDALWRFPKNIYTVLTENKRVFDTEQGSGVIAENLPVKRESTFKAWVPIMAGCNNFCSYCIVPYVRGRERSREKNAVLAEVTALVRDGYKEITLLGQNVNSYYKDLDGSYDFPSLLADINAIDGDFIVRFMTSHPKDASEKLFDTMARCEKIERHIHLPVQSGSDDILSAMNRRYTSESYLKLIEYAKKTVPGITFTSDIIVGFPGETDEDFDKTLELIRQVGFCGLYMFIYSKRNGTPAAEMENQISKEVKQSRFERLTELQSSMSESFHRQFVGTNQRMLIDSVLPDCSGIVSGRASNNIIIQAQCGENNLSLGQFAYVEIEKSMNWALSGKIINKE